MTASHCTLTMREIINITAQVFEISPVELTSARKEAPTVRARNAAAYIIRELLPRSFPEIGRALGGRDHATIIHACNAVTELMETDAAYAAKIAAIRNFCLPARSLDQPDVDPFEAASRILRSPREATGVSVETIRDLAAIAVAALQEATRQEAARANELARQAAATPVPAPAPDPQIEQLRAELAEARREIELLVNTPHPLAQPLREWTLATIAAETASGPAQRAANQRVEKASLALLLAAETHFNIKRSFK